MTITINLFPGFFNLGMAMSGGPSRKEIDHSSLRFALLSHVPTILIDSLPHSESKGSILRM